MDCPWRKTAGERNRRNGITQAVGGAFADQWLEVIEPENMGDQTVLTAGIRTGKGANRKGGKDSISNGSVIHVYEGQFMMLLDGGRIVDYSAEPGYFTVDNSSMPSMFSGSLDDVVKNSFDRFRFGGTAPTSQKVLYLNLQEIKGTPSAILIIFIMQNYF